jgi:hypothetical protein
MIGPEHERVRAGQGTRFFDSVSIDFCNGEHDVCVLVRLTRLPNSSSARAFALLFVDGEAARVEAEVETAPESWEHAAVGGVALDVLSPLESWRAAVSGDASLQLEARAASPPVGLFPDDVSLAGLTGIESYEQLCELDGSIELGGGGSVPLHCLGRRVHSWGEIDWSRIEVTRSLYGVSGEHRAIVFESARPTGSGGHGDERRVARLVAAQEETQTFEDARLSTVYGDDGLPAKAGLELFLPGEEYPRRLGGQAIRGAWSDDGPERSAISFFRWSMEGTPAFGLYEAVVSG